MNFSFLSEIEVVPDKLDEVAELASVLINQHLPRKGWTFEFNNGKRNLGRCRERSKIIFVSRHYALNNSIKEIEDTILHEICHALAGCKNGHNWIWKSWCIKLGCKPERLAKEGTEEGQVILPKGNWETSCPSCKKTFKKYRKPKCAVGYRCVACNVELPPWKRV